MDFFQHQANAKRNTLILYGLFALALVVIVLAVYAAVMLSWYILPAFWRGTQAPAQWWQPQHFMVITLATLSLIAAGSWYKIRQLKQGGGVAVASMLGGRRLRQSKDPQEWQLRNVVEEMAVASGMPVPAIFILEQQGINAFAAGYTHQDMAIAVTRGALDMLSRDELQGVVAHEFSHLLHGDTALKMTMMGLLHGITMVSDAGILLIAGRNTTAHTRYQGGSHPFLMLSGILIFMVGLVGMLAADMIKAAMSRQREYLADAAAVQFTRNPSGIAGALKMMGGYKAGSRLRLPQVQQVSHLFFGDALQSWWHSDWWATHPPLLSRIQRVEPSFRGHMPKLDEAVVREKNRAQASMMFASAPDTHTLNQQVATAMQSQMIDHIGEPSAEHLHHAERLLRALPDEVRLRMTEVVVSKAVGYMLLMDADKAVARRQLQVIRDMGDSASLRELLRLLQAMPKVEVAWRLPLLDMLLPHMATLEEAARQPYLQTLQQLLATRGEADLFAYLMYHSIWQALLPSLWHQAARKVALARCRAEVSLLLQAVAQYNTGAKARRAQQDAFAALFPGYAFKAQQKPALPAVVQALKVLRGCSPEDKRRLLKAVVHGVLSDGMVKPEEIELVRLVAMLLDCPMPILAV